MSVDSYNVQPFAFPVFGSLSCQGLGTTNEKRKALSKAIGQDILKGSG